MVEVCTAPQAASKSRHDLLGVVVGIVVAAVLGILILLYATEGDIVGLIAFENVYLSLIFYFAVVGLVAMPVWYLVLAKECA
jgi:high-affinity Fe2+/Pb2+ permease